MDGNINRKKNCVFGFIRFTRVVAVIFSSCAKKAESIVQDASMPRFKRGVRFTNLEIFNKKKVTQY